MWREVKEGMDKGKDEDGRRRNVEGSGERGNGRRRINGKWINGKWKME